MTIFTRIKPVCCGFTPTINTPTRQKQMPYRTDYVTMTDADLVRLCQTSAHEKDGAFTSLVVRYQQRIYLAARKMVHGDHDEADEIAQDSVRQFSRTA
jgi:hypothetical protein